MKTPVAYSISVSPLTRREHLREGQGLHLEVFSFFSFFFLRLGGLACSASRGFDTGVTTQTVTTHVFTFARSLRRDFELIVQSLRLQT